MSTMMFRYIFLVFAIFLSGCVSNKDMEREAFFLGSASGVAGHLRLLPLIDKTDDEKLKKAYAINLTLDLSALIALNPRIKDLDAHEITPLCEAATIGVPFLKKYTEEDPVTKLVITYLVDNKEEIVSTFNKQPLIKYNPSPCAETLRNSTQKSPNNSFQG